MIAKAPFGRQPTADMPGTMRADGCTAPFAVDKPIDGESPPARVRQHLAPALRPGGIVAPAKRSRHEVTGASEAIAADRRRTAIPVSYSLDRPLRELAFAKFAKRLRDAAERTVDRRFREFRSRLLDEHSAGESRLALRSCRYGDS